MAYKSTMCCRKWSLNTNHPQYLQNHGAFLALLAIFKRFNAMYEFKLDLENSDIDMKLILDKKMLPDIFCTGNNDEIMIPIEKKILVIIY